MRRFRVTFDTRNTTHVVPRPTMAQIALKWGFEPTLVGIGLESGTLWL